MLRPRMAALMTSILAVSSLAVGAEFKPSEVIVKYKEGVFRTRSAVNALYQSIGVKSVKRFSGLMRGYEHLILDENADVHTAISGLQSDRSVAYAQPNYIVHALPIAEARGANTASNIRPNFECW